MLPLAPAFELARRFEGLRLEAYHDAAGFPTQGYGRLLSRQRYLSLDGFPPITVATAEAWLRADLARATRAVLRLCPVPLSEARLAALSDFAFNAGSGTLEASALRQQVLAGRHDAVAAEFGRWVHAGGVRLAGLVRRRRAEAALYAAG